VREHLLGRSPDLGRVREAGVIQFVMIRESSIERRPKPWNVKMAMHRGGMGRRDMPMLLGDFLLLFLFGRMGQWNGDRDCEPAQLTGCLLGGQASSLPSTEHRTPLRPLRGGVLIFRNREWPVSFDL